MTEEPATLNPDEARQGRKVGRMRYVLSISLAAIIIFMGILMLLWW